jgi:hypothetical protein
VGRGGSVGLGSVGLGRAELGWVGLGWAELGWVGLGWVGLVGGPCRAGVLPGVGVRCAAGGRCGWSVALQAFSCGFAQGLMASLVA